MAGPAFCALAGGVLSGQLFALSQGHLLLFGWDQGGLVLAELGLFHGLQLIVLLLCGHYAVFFGLAPSLPPFLSATDRNRRILARGHRRNKFVVGLAAQQSLVRLLGLFVAVHISRGSSGLLAAVSLGAHLGPLLTTAPPGLLTGLFLYIGYG